MASKGSYEVILLLTSIRFCACHLISIFINAYLPYSPVEYRVLPFCFLFCKSDSHSVSDSIMSQLVIIVVVTRI